MALGAAYATPEQLEARLGKPDDGTFTRVLESASRAVEAFARRQFNRADAPSFRRYRALDSERVAVHDFFTLDDLIVEVNGSVWNTETTIDPRPWSLSGPTDWPDDFYGEERPYSDLFAVGRSFPWSRRGLISVHAWWGWPMVPAAIVEATLDVAQLTSAFGQAALIKSEVISGYSYSTGLPAGYTVGDSGVPMEMLKALPYRRKRFGIA